ncbi:MAG: Holliday junction resolvase Hjc [Candidatus Undinarchaeales archaeon]
MRYKKQKGSNAERELVEKFWEKGFAAIRVAGSGVSKFPCPDVLASDGSLSFAVESKSYSGNYIHLKRGQILQLLEFSQKFGAVPVVGIRFAKNDWYFFDMIKIQSTKGENFKVTRKIASEDGKGFEELIENYRKAQES